MAFETTPDGGIVITGEEDVQLARLIALKHGLRFEVNNPGMKLGRGRTCHAIIKAEFGLKGNKERVLEQFTALLDEKLAQRQEEGTK